VLDRPAVVAEGLAPHAQQRVLINCPYPLRRGDLLRRRDRTAVEGVTFE
jgi:hypothetical protein